ncbi:hypothetical protein MMC29_002204, partial [Sticta canariensis]|nr:hypothetical protein [Sticta canariensis]
PVSLASRIGYTPSLTFSSAPAPAQSQSSKTKVKANPKECSTTQTSTMVDEELAKADETILFKGGSLTRLQRAIKSGSNILPPPSDLTQNQPLWYFTKKQSVADVYADWLRNGLGKEKVEVGILSVVIANDLLKNFVQFYDNDI